MSATGRRPAAAAPTQEPTTVGSEIGEVRARDLFGGPLGSAEGLLAVLVPAVAVGDRLDQRRALARPRSRDGGSDRLADCEYVVPVDAQPRHLERRRAVADAPCGHLLRAH